MVYHFFIYTRMAYKNVFEFGVYISYVYAYEHKLAQSLFLVWHVVV